LTDTTIESEAAAKLRNMLAENADLELEVRKALALGEAVVFGGWVRDALHSILHGEVLLSRDFDIVVQGSLLLRKADGETNHFGGRRLSLPDGLSIDCWELSRTLAFTRGLLAASFPNLLRSTVYRVNGCYIDLRNFRLQSEGAVEDIRDRRISFNCKGYLDIYPEYQAFRAIDLRDRLGYALDDEVARFVSVTLKKAGPQRFAHEVREHRRHEPTERLDRLFRAYVG